MLFNDLFRIERIIGREVIDSRGNPTVEAEVYTFGGGYGRFSVPAGASKGVYEALELRDGDKRRFHGMGVSKAVKNINERIAPVLKGMDARFQREVDMKLIELDGTENKSNLGANAILAVSVAVAKAAADTMGLPLFMWIGGANAHLLPVPLMNILNGGKHAGNKLAIQEFMIVPIGATSFREALRMGVEVYHELKSYLKAKYGLSAINVGDEGGFAPPMEKTHQALDALVGAVEEAGYDPKSEVVLGLDCAASSFYDREQGKYAIDGKLLDKGELMDYYLEILSGYPVKSVEDPFQEEDFEAFAEFTKKVGNKIQVVGDDLFVTNPARLRKGIEVGAANALLMKVNQIGTLTEALDAATLALRNGYNVIVSHRSGETEDTAIADIAVALNAGQIKTGAPGRGERTAKYNRLLRIEELLGLQARYPGMEIFSKFK